MNPIVGTCIGLGLFFAVMGAGLLTVLCLFVAVLAWDK